MQKKRIVVPAILFVAAVSLSGCGQPGGLFERIGNFGGRIFGTGDGANQQTVVTPQNATAGTPPPIRILPNEGSRGFLGLGRNVADPGPQVNAYLWAAALDVLGYLPIQGADPVSGRFSTGYGTAPGSSRAFTRAPFRSMPACRGGWAATIAAEAERPAWEVRAVRRGADALPRADLAEGERDELRRESGAELSAERWSPGD